jgi:hypothetical protein
MTRLPIEDHYHNYLVVTPHIVRKKYKKGKEEILGVRQFLK